MSDPRQEKDPVVIVGAHNEIIELCELLQREIVGLIQGPEPYSHSKYTTLGTDDDAQRLGSEYRYATIVVTPDNPATRRQLVSAYCHAGFSLATLIHPSAIISPSAKIGAGTVIQTGVNISTNTAIGQCVKINTYANIMHDCEIGNHVTIAPNAVVLGRVTLSDACYIGAGAIILPELTIGSEAVVGAGAVVTKNVPSGVTVVGNPAGEFRRQTT